VADDLAANGLQGRSTRETGDAIITRLND